MADGRHLLFLTSDAHARTTWTFEQPKAAFSLKRTHARGVGLFASRNIAAGERLLAEAPLATWSVAVGATSVEKCRSFDDMVARLSKEITGSILRLSQSPRYGQMQSLLGTWQTNGLPINYESTTRPGTTTSELASRKEAAVFATICRLNHCCSPNVHFEWNGALGLGTVHALVDIAVGRELVISYLPPGGLTRETRRAQLLADHGFECQCAKCSLAGDALAMSDARQRAIGQMMLRPEERDLPVPEMLRRLDVRLTMMDEEGMPHLWAWKARFYHLAVASRKDRSNGDASHQSQSRRHAATMLWARRAFDALRIGLGADHPATLFVATLLVPDR